MSNYKLQLLRNTSTLYTTKDDAKTALAAKLQELQDGGMAVARYQSGDVVKTLLGVVATFSSVTGDQYTIFDADAIPSEVQDAIDAILGEGTINENYDTIKEIADALVIINGDDSTDGSIKKALKDAGDYTDDQFDTINPLVEVEQVLKEASNYSSTEADLYRFTKHTGATTDVQLTFTPISPLALTVPEEIGDIAQGTTAESLNGMPISQLLDSILFKTIYPTITAASATVRFASGFTSGSLVTAGTAGPTDDNMGYTLNQGTVAVDDGVTASTTYVGSATGVTYQETYSAGAANTNAGVAAGGTAYTAQALSGNKLTVGTYTYRGIVSYAQGPTMYTSKGDSPNPITTTNMGEVTNPCPAGSITTSYNVNIPVTLPVYVDTGNGTYTQQTLKTWGAMTFTGVSMLDQNASSPSRVKTPRKINTINSYNAVSGAYDVAQIGNYTMQETTETINDVSVTYYEYTWTGGALSAVNFEIITY